MAEKPSPEETALWRRRVASQANNRAWALADTLTRTSEEDEEMLQAAHAAMYLWKMVGDASNRAHAAQLLAHVCGLLRLPGPAKHYLSQSQPHFRGASAAPWEVAYAHLVAANVACAASEHALHQQHYASAVSAIAGLSDEEEKDILNTSLRVVPPPGGPKQGET